MKLSRGGCWSAGGARCAALAMALATGGCGGLDGVELNGGVFDYFGVSAKSQSRSEPKLAERGGIVVPPDPDRLPVPGSEVAAEAGQVLWPSDPDEKRKLAAADSDRRHTEFCEKALIQAKLRGDHATVKGPNGPCTQSILSSTVNNIVPQTQAPGGSKAQ